MLFDDRVHHLPTQRRHLGTQLRDLFSPTWVFCPRDLLRERRERSNRRSTHSV